MSSPFAVVAALAAVLIACADPEATEPREAGRLEARAVDLGAASLEVRPEASRPPDHGARPDGPLSGQPLHAAAGSCAITLAGTGDPADVYYPEATGTFPIALLMQGAKVDKQHYSGFARTVARYGFIVVVPNHDTLMGKSMVEEKLVVEALAQLKLEQAGSTALAGRVDAKTLVLLGHSFGGAASLYAIQGLCQLPFCFGAFTRPPELAGGAFYGTNLKPPFGDIPPVKNAGLPILLLQGSQDGKALPADALKTFQQIEQPPKALLTIKGANHYGIADANNPPGADADPKASGLAQSVAIETAARWSALFLRAYVLKDAAALAYLQKTGVTLDPNVTLELQ